MFNLLSKGGGSGFFAFLPRALRFMKDYHASTVEGTIDEGRIFFDKISEGT
jgi:hypothetical protein